MRQTQEKLKSLQSRFHAACVVCGRENPQGMKLPFHTCKDGSVKAWFFCDQLLQGYPGLMHGGVIAAILDGAMMNCLFAQGRIAVTGVLTVCFVSPLAVKQTATVRARVKKSISSCHILESELLQGRRTVAKATAKFMECTEHFLRQHKIAEEERK
ncbi:MAG: PaaI family thioesterase [Candidatus Omnitrophota bacterium]